MDLRKRLRQCNLDVLFNLLPDKIINNNSSEILYFFINYENKKLGYALTDNAMQNDDANEYITNFNPNNIAESLINVIMLCCKNHQISEKAIEKKLPKASLKKQKKILLFIIILLGIMSICYLIFAFLTLDILWALRSDFLGLFLRVIYFIIVLFFITVGIADDKNISMSIPK